MANNKKSRIDRVKNSISDNLVPKFRGRENSTLFGTGTTSTKNDDTDVDPEEFKELYKRNPIAFRGIQKYSQDPVQSGFDVKDKAEAENMTEFEKDVDEILDKVDFDKHFIKVLKYSFLYGSAEMAYGLVHSSGSENAEPGEPVNKETVETIDYVNVVKQPFVEEYVIDRDPMSRTFGELEAVKVNIDTEDEDGNNNQITLSNKEIDTRKIHRSRFQHFKAFEVDEHPEGFGLLHPAYNTLKTFDNILFGAGQSFFYAGTGFPHFEVEGMDEEEFENFKTELGNNILEEPYFASEKGKIDMEFKGAKGKVLDPTNYFEPLWNILGSTFGGSKQVLFGTEAGELKGSEVNKEEYYGDVESFQAEECTPFVRKFIDRMIDYGVVSEPRGDGYKVKWNEMYSKSEEVKSEIANNKSKAFARYKQAGLSNKEAAELADIDINIIENPEETGTASENAEDPGGRDEIEEQEANAEDSKEAVTDNEDLEMDVNIHVDRYNAVTDMIEAFEEVEFDADQYFGQAHDHAENDGPEKMANPAHWNNELYDVYKDMREDLIDMHHEFVDDVVELVDRSSLSSDSAEQDEKRLVKAQFDQRVQRRLDEFKEDAEERTKTGMRDSFLIGAREGAEDLDLTPDEIFNKHREQVVEELADTHMTEAYANSTEAVDNKINDAVLEYYDDKEQGIDDLKRNIRSVAGGDSSMDYRYERIARTETARLRNTGYVTESHRQGYNQFDWTGPIDDLKCDLCLSIIDGNPYTHQALVDSTNGLVPHPNCRDTAVVAESELTEE